MSIALQATHRTPRMESLPATLTIGSTDWPLRVQRHPRARRISLRISAPSASCPLPSIVLTVPKRASLAHGMKFLQANTVWLARELDRHRPATTATDGTSLYLLGRNITFRHSGNLRGLPREDGDTVWLSGEPSRFGARLEAYLAKKLDDFAHEEATKFADTLGVTANRIYSKTMRARWGSCSPDRDIALNWRLILAPEHVARYVVAHEMAHLREMNHSAHFWAHVRTLMPDFAQAREWLKREGHTLYQWQF